MSISMTTLLRLVSLLASLPIFALKLLLHIVWLILITIGMMAALLALLR